MQLAGAEKLARRLYRGDIDEGGRPYVEHLARVAALVASDGGDECEQAAAWLHHHGRPGMTPQEMTARRLPRRAIRIVQALGQNSPWEPADSQAARIRSCPGAALVLRADAADLCSPEELAALTPAVRQRRTDRYRDLLARLGTPMPAEPSRAAKAGSVDVEDMLAQLAATNPDRWAAVRRLGSVGELRAARPLIDAYLGAQRGDPAWAGGKAELAGAISKIAAHRGHLDDPDWVHTLAGLSAHSDPFLRASAVRGLTGLAEHEPLVLGALSDDSPQVAAAAVTALDARQIRDHADAVTAIAARPGREWARLRRQAIQRLQAAGCPPSCDVMLAAVAADGMALGRQALSAFARQSGQSVIPELIGQVRDRAKGRAAAAFVLGEVRATDAVAALASALSAENQDPLLAVACTEALAKIGDASAAPALVTAARHRLAWVRGSALTALSKLNDVDVTQVALEASEDFDPDVREKAVRVLAARGDQRATARLLLFCDGPLAIAALRGLIRIADERAVPALRQVFLNSNDRRIRHLAGQALARSARRAGGLYLGWWLSPPQARAVAWVLGEIGDETSAPALCRMLAHRDELVRARAAAALGKIADPETAPALRAALGDISPRVRASAATAIGRLRVSDANEWLEPMRGDLHPAVRSAASAAMETQPSRS